MMLKARPTTYKGIRMRSRLEATFAQHCDQAGLAWRYEPGCFADETDQYLPDFAVEVGGEVAYVEVKPREADAAEWIDGPMRRVWASQPDAHLVTMHPEKRPYESTKWSFAWRNPPTTTWRSIFEHLPLRAQVTDDTILIDYKDECPAFDQIRIDLIDDAQFLLNYTEKIGELWQGPELEMGHPYTTWRLVAPRTPDNAWFPSLIEVSDVGIITDCYAGQHFFLNDLWGKLTQVSYTCHPYG